jgi:hypothetical protein
MLKSISFQLNASLGEASHGERAFVTSRNDRRHFLETTTSEMRHDLGA